MGRCRGMLAIGILLVSVSAPDRDGIALDRAVQRSPRSFAAKPPPSPGPGSHQRRSDELAAGKFLIASEQVTGPFFYQSVVLLLDYDPSGALGVIINHPTDAPLALFLPGLTALKERRDTVWLGGPVGRDSMAFLIRSDEAPPDSMRLRDDLHVSGSARALRHVVEKDLAADRFRAYVGYAGWAPGQLDAEVLRGDWYIARAETEHIFETAPEEVWPQLIRENKGVHVRAPGDRAPPAPVADESRRRKQRMAGYPRELAVIHAMIGCGEIPSLCRRIEN